MPKMKAHKGLRKRVKISASGKVKRKRANGGHLMSTKNAKRQRRINGPSQVIGKLAKTVRISLLGE